MMNKTEFTKIAKRIFHFKQGVQDIKITHPTREWGVGLFIGAIIFCVTAVWSIQTYLSNKNFIDVDGSSHEESVVYREVIVKAALEAYALRDKLHLQLLNNTKTVVPGSEMIVASSSEEAKEDIKILESQTEGSFEVDNLEQETDASTEDEVLDEEVPKILLTD